MATVLIVEDEAVVLILAESVLQEAGHKTLTAANVVQALAILADSAAHPIDLLFTDLRLGDAEHGGFEVAQQAIKAKRETRVLYTTTQVVTDGMRELFVAGSEFLPKPYTVPQLTAAIEKLLKAN